MSVQVEHVGDDGEIHDAAHEAEDAAPVNGNGNGKRGGRLAEVEDEMFDDDPPVVEVERSSKLREQLARALETQS